MELQRFVTCKQTSTPHNIPQPQILNISIIPPTSNPQHFPIHYNTNTITQIPDETRFTVYTIIKQLIPSSQGRRHRLLSSYRSFHQNANCLRAKSVISTLTYTDPPPSIRPCMNPPVSMRVVEKHNDLCFTSISSRQTNHIPHHTHMIPIF